MVQDDMSAPATKQDLENLKLATRQDLENVREATKQDVQLLDSKTQGSLQVLQDQITTLAEYVGTLPTKEDMKKSFDTVLLAFEDARYDFMGIYKDKITDHEQRIVTLELETGLRRR